jgi:hypothetical protein
LIASEFIKFFIAMGIQLHFAAGGIRRSLDFPGAVPVSPGSHQGTSILVTTPTRDWPGAFIPLIIPLLCTVFKHQYNGMKTLYLIQ